jgi:hypothetical protein
MHLVANVSTPGKGTYLRLAESRRVYNCVAGGSVMSSRFKSKSYVPRDSLWIVAAKENRLLRSSGKT